MGAPDLSQYLWPDVAQGRQPQYAARIETGNSLARGLFVSIEANTPSDPVTGLVYDTGSTIPPIAKSYGGVGRNTTGATLDERELCNPGIGATSPWSLGFTFLATSNVSLSHCFGFGNTFASGVLVSTAGALRGVLNYLNDYYFWGANTDWDTGIAFDVDGLVHTVMFTDDGTNLYFYRDGVLRAQTARPSGLIAVNSGTYAVIGNRHPSGTVSPSATFFAGRAWNRALSASEAQSYAANPWRIFAAPLSIWAKTASAIPTLSAATMSGITSTGGYPRVTRA